jgi:cytochrome P450
MKSYLRFLNKYNIKYLNDFFSFISRFSAANKSNIKSFSFLPFGAGPRNCIGARFAMLEAKLAIMRVLQKYRFEPSGNGQVC